MIDKTLFSTLVAQEFAKFTLSSKSKDFRLNTFPDNINTITKPLLKAKMSLILSEKITAVKKSDSLYLIMQAFYWLKKQNNKKTLEIINYLHPKKKEIKALKNLLLAQIALKEGDLQSVSQETAMALPVFHKKRMFAEAASAYFTLGTAYRITGIYDTADFMLREALTIYQALSSKTKTSEVLGNLGLLMAAQLRFEEADSYYKQAQQIISVKENRELYHFIVSQQAMLALLQKDGKTSVLFAQKALKGHRSNAGKSFAADILARAYLAQEKWSDAYKWGLFSAERYSKEKNYASVFECQYLAAEALVGKNKLPEAENLLRELIKKEKYHKSCFHIANAYTLLGLILLKKGDTQGAKTIFNQALKQELYNERNTGIAVDYMNLAAVEKKCGNIDAAHKNLENALAYAKDFDEVLYKKIQAILN